MKTENKSESPLIGERSAEELLLAKFGVKKKTELMTQHFIGLTVINNFLEAMEEYVSQFKPQSPVDVTQLKEPVESQDDVINEIADATYDDCIQWYMRGYMGGKMTGFDKNKFKELLSMYSITRKESVKNK